MSGPGRVPDWDHITVHQHIDFDRTEDVQPRCESPAGAVLWAHGDIGRAEVVGRVSDALRLPGDEDGSPVSEGTRQPCGQQRPLVHPRAGDGSCPDCLAGVMLAVAPGVPVMRCDVCGFQESL